MAEASHQLYRVPKAQESKTQKERQGGQQGVVLVDLDRQTDTQTFLPSAFFPQWKTVQTPSGKEWCHSLPTWQQALRVV